VEKREVTERYYYLLMDFITLFFVVSVFFSTASAQHPPQILRGCHILVSMPLDFTSKAMGTLSGFLLLEFLRRLLSGLQTMMAHQSPEMLPYVSQASSFLLPRTALWIKHYVEVRRRRA
jgi:hypothetical protein